MGHRGVGDRIDHLGAFFDDARLLEVPAHHEAGDVLKKENGQVDLIAELDEMGPFLCRVGIDDTIVAQDPDRESLNRGKSADHGGSPARFELLEA